MRSLTIAVLPLTLAAAQDMAVQPGKWQNTVTIIDVRMANAPPGLAAAMKGKPTVIATCVTPEQAKAGPRAAMRPDSGCKFTRYQASGGRIATEMTCSRPGGAMTVVSSGTYTPTSYTMTGRATATGAMAMTITSRTVGKRLGGC